MGTAIMETLTDLSCREGPFNDPGEMTLKFIKDFVVIELNNPRRVVKLYRESFLRVVKIGSNCKR